MNGFEKFKEGDPLLARFVKDDQIKVIKIKRIREQFKSQTSKKLQRKFDEKTKEHYLEWKTTVLGAKKRVVLLDIVMKTGYSRRGKMIKGVLPREFDVIMLLGHKASSK